MTNNASLVAFLNLSAIYNYTKSVHTNLHFNFQIKEKLTKFSQMGFVLDSVDFYAGRFRNGRTLWYVYVSQFWIKNIFLSFLYSPCGFDYTAPA